MQKNNASWNTYKLSTPFSITIDGQTQSGSTSVDLRGYPINTDYYIGSFTFTVQHEINGTKLASVSAVVDMSGTSAGYGTVSGAMDLNTIAVTPPTITSVTLTDEGGAYTAVSRFAATITQMKLVVVAASAITGGTIARYDFYLNGSLLQSGVSDTYTESGTASAGNRTYKIVVTDSYGLTSETYTVTIGGSDINTNTNPLVVYPYTPPSFTSISFERGTETGGVWVAGAGGKIKCTALFSIASVDGQNHAKNNVWNLWVSPYGTSGSSLNSGGNGQSVIAGNDNWADYALSARIYVTDLFDRTARTVVTVPSQSVSISQNPQGGLGFGTLATEIGKALSSFDIKTVGKGIEISGLASTSDTAITIGSTTLSEAQLIQLLALI